MTIEKIVTAKNTKFGDILRSDSEIFLNNLNDACTCTGNECYA